MMTSIQKPKEKECDYWPECSFYGLFEGYNGVACVDFLKDHLVWFILKTVHFPSDPKKAIFSGF